MGQKFSVRKFLSHPNKICPTPKFSEIRAKASLASQTTFSSLSMAIGKEEKVAKRRKGNLDNKTKSRLKFYHEHGVDIRYACMIAMRLV